MRRTQSEPKLIERDVFRIVFTRSAEPRLLIIRGFWAVQDLDNWGFANILRVLPFKRLFQELSPGGNERYLIRDVCNLCGRDVQLRSAREEHRERL